jgi:REP element-mobilizing transposase RayT
MPRISLGGVLYYITSRGNHSQKIFNDDQDYQTYLQLLSKYKQEYGFKLFSYVLLPDHLHLLIELKEGLTISEIMHALNSSYIKYFNARHNRRGHLFEGRYKLNLLEKEPYLLYMSAYMHLNPCRLNLASQPGEYKYSSLSSYLGKQTQISMDEEIKEIVSFLDNEKSYQDFIGSILKDELQVLSKQLHAKRILGSDEFKKMVKQEIKKYESQIQGGKKVMNKKLILAGASTIAVFLIASIFLFGTNAKLKKTFDKTSQEKEKEFIEKVEEEKQRARQDVKEFYKANMISYKAMSKRLEYEKEKVKELEGKLNEDEG